MRINNLQCNIRYTSVFSVNKTSYISESLIIIMIIMMLMILMITASPSKKKKEYKEIPDSNQIIDRLLNNPDFDTTKCEEEDISANTDISSTDVAMDATTTASAATTLASSNFTKEQ